MDLATFGGKLFAKGLLKALAQNASKQASQRCVAGPHNPFIPFQGVMRQLYGKMNCLNVADVVDDALAAGTIRAAAGSTIPIRLANKFEGKADVEHVMTGLGSGSRGILAVFPKNQKASGHPHNVFVRDGVVHYVDGQVWQSGWQDGFSEIWLLITSP